MLARNGINDAFKHRRLMMLLSIGMEHCHRNLSFTSDPLLVPSHLRNPKTRKFGPTTTSSSADDLASLLTLPSHQSLAPSLLEPPPFSASFCISSLQIAGAPTAIIAVYAPSLLLYSTSIPRSPSTTSPPFASSTPSPLPCCWLCLVRCLLPRWPRLHRPPRRSDLCLEALPPLWQPSHCGLPPHRRRSALPPRPSLQLHHHSPPQETPLDQHTDVVSAVSTADDLLYSISWDKTLKIWCAFDHRCNESVAVHDDVINVVAIATNGTVYTWSTDRRIKVWSRSLGERRHLLVATLERHRSAVNALSMSGDGVVLYSRACDRSILVWEREDRANHMAVTRALRGHQKAIMCLACVGDLVFRGLVIRR